MEAIYAHIEAVLFSAAKPMPLGLLADVFEVPQETMRELLDTFGRILEEEGHGLRLRQSGMGFELVTLPSASSYISRIRRKEDKLSSAALETLAVVAFKQPVTKAEVEEVRGVNCEKVLKHLLSRQLIRELGRKDAVGRPTLYGTTEEFLRSAGIDSVADLRSTVEHQASDTVSKPDGLSVNQENQ